ncbi:MAG: helix-turn-helix domain-containing protein [Acutalibacteraceae bacterium]
MKVKEAVVERVKSICNMRGIRYNELAVRSGVTPSTVYSMLDPSRKEVSLNTIKKLCDGLDMSIIEFFESEIFMFLDQEIE